MFGMHVWHACLACIASSSGVTPLMLLAAAGNVRGHLLSVTVCHCPLLAAGNVRGVRLLLEHASGGGGGGVQATSLLDATTENGTAALHTASRQARLK